MTRNTTFEKLESERDHILVDEGGESPLEVWYVSVRTKPLCEFSQEDLCKACRQGLFPTAVVPVALEKLRNDPLTGEKYDGELICAILTIDKDYWSKHPSQAQEVASIGKSIIGQVDEDFSSDLDDFVKRNVFK